MLSDRNRPDSFSNLRGLLSIRRMDKFLNAQIRELCGVTKGVDERIDEGVLRWFGHGERMENDRIAKWVFVGECVGSRSVGRTRKRWIDTVQQARRIVHDRSVWREFVRGMDGNSPRD